MKAIVKVTHEPGAHYIDVEKPQIGDHEVLVKIKACAICGTDIHIYQWNEWAQRTVPKIFGRQPRIMGHEFCGEVCKVGSLVTKVKPGDRIAGETHIACGNCYLCRTGEEYNCQFMGRFRNGVFAEYAAIPEYGAEVVPDFLSDELASLFEPFGVAIHAAQCVSLVGDTVVVMGTGAIGLFVVVMSRIMGAARIIAVDISGYRLSLAQKIGADVVINPLHSDVVAVIKDLTSGLGADVIFETSGNVAAIKQGFDSLRKCGTCLMIGLPSEPLVLDACSDIVWKGARVIGIHGRDNFASWEIAKRLMINNRIDLNPIITHRFTFEDFEKAFEVSASGNAGKVILKPHE